MQAAQTLVVGETGLYDTFATTTVQTVGPQGWVDLHLTALRPVLEALAGTLGEAMRMAGDDPEAEEELSAMLPGMPAGHADRRRAADGRARVARRAGGLDDRIPRAARVRALRPAAPHRRATRRRRAQPVLRGGERRRVRRRVDAPARRPPLLPRAPRSGARGACVPCAGCERGCAPRGRLRVELRDRPDGVRGGVRHDRPERPGVARGHDVEPGAHPRRHAIAAPGRRRSRSSSG